MVIFGFPSIRLATVQRIKFAMEVILFSLFMVVAAAAAGPLVNTTMHVVQPIGDTFTTIAVTTAAPSILDNVRVCVSI